MNRFRPLALTTFVLLRSVLLPAMDGKSGLLDPVLGGVTPSDLHEEVDSHAGEERHSVLEPVYEYMQLLPASHLQTDRTAIYPRIKKMADGRYILFCQGGQIASRIYCYTSADLKSWSKGRLLFEPREIETSRGLDVRCYSTADAVVLANGDLLVACSFRASAGYKYGVGCGIVLKRSRDHGRTWSDEQVIFEGTNWEPYLLQLPDGRVQCYFTDCLPATRNSGTSVITSADNGHTWGNHMRVCRQYKYDDEGVAIFTDQMPCFRLLKDGTTLFGFLEARLEPEGPSGKSVYKMSIVRNRGFDWQPLGEMSAGPVDRETNVVEGCAGYVSVFPSGETLVSCNIDRVFSLKIGDCEGRRFNGRSWNRDWFQPFAGEGFWGSLEPLDAHRVIGAMHCDAGIQLGVFYLNHRIDAPHVNTLSDGNALDWENRQSLFIGGDSPSRVFFRASRDDDFFYLYVDYKTCSDDFSIDMRLDTLPLTINVSGLTDAKEGIEWVEEPLSELENQNRRLKIAIPLSLLGVHAGDELRFNAVLRDQEVRDTFTFADPSDPDTWMRIRLK